ncbi:PLDc N-terminal domain-containing protein [Salinibacterium sp. PAMC 21357]|uniref:PLDc N-terminal domain-containing protein n=1 Tax=Salinibacterium sp. PAMC 21357 TaxID=1112215 RepID=UPI0002897509|nr:PLDc N-terminal domain-containing protein [Salinibacterium sp. PAMC 21357]
MDPISISFSFVGFVIFIIAAVSIIKSTNHGAIGKFLWFLVALLLPIVGPILWFLLGRGKVRN